VQVDASGPRSIHKVSSLVLDTYRTWTQLYDKSVKLHITLILGACFNQLLFGCTSC